jgi:lysyl-tRNA synthetase class 2
MSATGSTDQSNAHAGAATALDENKLIAERREKLHGLREKGIAFPNDFRATHLPVTCRRSLPTRNVDRGERSLARKRVRVAGRMLAKRIMGKASFAQIQDMSGRIQLFLQGTALGEAYDAFKGWDIGDIVAAEGVLMRTKHRRAVGQGTDIRAADQVAAPAAGQVAWPCDVEQRYRQRYVDLIVTPEAREVFVSALADHRLRCASGWTRGVSSKSKRR